MHVWRRHVRLGPVLQVLKIRHLGRIVSAQLHESSKPNIYSLRQTSDLSERTYVPVKNRNAIGSFNRRFQPGLHNLGQIIPLYPLAIIEIPKVALRALTEQEAMRIEWVEVLRATNVVDKFRGVGGEDEICRGNQAVRGWIWARGNLVGFLISVFGLPDEVVEFRADVVRRGRYVRAGCGPLSVHENYNGSVFSLVHE